jgi:hypothetical protein
MKSEIFSPLIWLIAAAVLILLLVGNAIMQGQEDAANEAYRAKVVAQRKAAQDKAFNDLAARGEFMTGFSAVSK